MNPATGCIKKQIDTRDYLLTKIQATIIIPPTFMQDFSAIPVEMQNQLGICCAEGGTFFAEASQYLKNKVMNRYSPAYMWKKMKLIDGIPPENGSSIEFPLKVLYNDGICDANLLPTDTTVDITTFTDPSVLTYDMDINAAPKEEINYAFIFNPTMDQIKQAIYQNKLVIARVEVGKEWYTPSWNPSDIFPLKPPVQVISGHCIVLYGYDQQYIYGRNSWSNQWGNNGNFYFGSDYIPHCTEIGTAIPKLQFNTNLFFLMKCPEVAKLQAKLGVIQTGFFGILTLLAVRSYQKANGIPATGYVGPLTRALLNK